jgi:hypothetical protein
MKILLILLMLIPSVSFSKDLILERDKWQPDKKFNVIDPDKNKKTGEYIKKSPWDSDKWIIYDEDGDKKGTIEKDPWNKNRFNIRKEKD